ncbi:MAG: hypothetical protein FJW90_10860 [Actinobacteria bacterium]|nr:hypothetical protein [Actinomycetota bacterium]
MPREPFEGSEWGERESARIKARAVARARAAASTGEMPAARSPGEGRPPAPAAPADPPRRRGRSVLIVAVAALALAGGGFVAANAGLTDSGEVGEVEFAAAKIITPVERLHAAQRARIKKAMSAPFVLGIPRKRLEVIAECESHGDPRAIGGGGLYRGKYQFHRGTWASVGGVGDPARASELEQDRRAAMLIKQSGSNPWPVCG